jgi:uncharacterized C2H2 Zn-finger protein
MPRPTIYKKNINNMFECPNCDKVYKNCAGVSRHVKIHRTKPKNIDIEPTILVKKTNSENVKIKATIFELTRENLIKEAIDFHKKNKLTNTDLMETIHEMLCTKLYTLEDEFKNSKLDFEESNVYFLSIIAPKTIKKDVLQKLLFNNI